MIRSTVTYSDKIKYWKCGQQASQNLKTLLPLQSTIGVVLRKKLALLGFTMDILQKIHNEIGKDGLQKHIQGKLKKEKG